MNPPIPHDVEPTFPTIIDNTILQAWAKCKRYAFLTYFCHYKTTTESTHLKAGSAFAAGIEAYRREFYFRSNASQLALIKGFIAICREYGDHVPTDPVKSMVNVILALLHYHNNFPPQNERFSPFLISNTETIEFSFAIPLDFKNPQTGEPVIFCGRADQIVRYSETGQLLIEDDKTTKQLGSYWFRQWDLESQFTGYIWAAQAYGFDVVGALVRGICFYSDRIEHMQVITYRTKQELHDWEEMVYHRLEEMKTAWEKHYYAPDLGKRCSDYGGCALQSYCKYDHKLETLKADFVRMRWDPAQRENILLP